MEPFERCILHIGYGIKNTHERKKNKKKKKKLNKEKKRGNGRDFYQAGRDTVEEYRIGNDLWAR